MQAITSPTYSAPEIVHIDEVTTPVPKSGEVLIHNYATVVSGAESTACASKSATRESEHV